MAKRPEMIERRRWVERARILYPRGFEVVLKQGWTFADLSNCRVFPGSHDAERNTSRPHVVHAELLYVAAEYRDGWVWLRRSDSAEFEKIVAVPTLRDAKKLVQDRIGIPCSQN